MEPALLALGVSLWVASLVPFLAGRLMQGGGMAYLGGVSWGSGLDVTHGTMMLIALGMAVVIAVIMSAIALGRKSAATTRSRAT